LSKNKLFRAIGKVYTDVIRGTPSVTQLMIIYFVVFATVDWAKWIICAIAFGINSGAYVSEIIRGGILSIDKGQTEAGRALGLSNTQTMTNIVIPQAVKNIFPALCNEFIVLIKETSVVSFIAVVEITKAFRAIGDANYEYVIPYLMLAAVYLVLVIGISAGVKSLERRMAKNERSR
jgi:polar amino acid transport system permease protein/polar amino acid transport system substrate-binding protein